MGLALETIVGYHGNLTGSTTFDALTVGTGQTFTVRAVADGSNAYLEDVFAADDDSIFQLSIKSPRMHDNVKGMLFAGTNLSSAVEQVFVPQWLMPGDSVQRLYSTDVLSVTANGTAADVVCAAFNVRYENLGGVSARLYSWDQIKPLIVNKLGNLMVGGPGGPDSSVTGNWFVEASVKYGIPHIPVIQSNNAGGVTVQIADLLTSGTPNVTVLMAQLSQKLPNPAG